MALTHLLVATVLAALPPMVAPAGRSLATLTGDRLFPIHAGERLPGWVESFDRPAMRIAYRGYSTQTPLPQGRTLVVLRHDGLVGAYVFAGDRCIGQVLGDPIALTDAAGFETHLRKVSRAPRPGFVTTSDRGYALDARFYTRRLGSHVEERVLIDWPVAEDGRATTRTVLGLDALYPAELEGHMRPLVDEALSGLATFRRQQPLVH